MGGGVVAGNGMIFGMPNKKGTVLRIDPLAKTTSQFGSFQTGYGKWLSAAVAGNGMIYGIPFSATTVLVIDPDASTATTIGQLSSPGVR